MARLKIYVGLPNGLKYVYGDMYPFTMLYTLYDGHCLTLRIRIGNTLSHIYADLK
jgi:hypothetical protein